jgi:hypothetical protein
MKMPAPIAAKILWLLCLAGGVLSGAMAMTWEGEALNPTHAACADLVPVHVKGRLVMVCASLAARLRWSSAAFVIFILLVLVSGLAAEALRSRAPQTGKSA